MKIKELDLSSYSYKRISISTDHGTAFLPENGENLLISEYGEKEIAENGVECSESGWLILTTAK